jgi:hypothetical protein
MRWIKNLTYKSTLLDLAQSYEYLIDEMNKKPNL